MPVCNQCGRKAGGFSLRGFNAATGRCDQCEIEVSERIQRALDTFRHAFLDCVDKGYLTRDDWTALQERADVEGLDRSYALDYVREDLSALIQAVLESQGKTQRLSQNEDAKFNLLVERLSLPDYCAQHARRLISATKLVAVSCVRCGAGVLKQASAFDYTCPVCSVRGVMARCPHCSAPNQIPESLWNRNFICLTCGRQHPWDRWQSARITMGEMSSTIKQDLSIIADPFRRIVSGTLIGGSGYAIIVGAGCTLEFASDKVRMYARLPGKLGEIIGQAEYREVTSLQLGGRGAVTSGGGWSGGGFGLTGIITGAVLASALNQMTTRSSIETVISLQTTAGELLVFNNEYTPEYLRIMLSPAFSRIEAGHRTLPAVAVDPIAQLRELGELRASQTITEEEFQRLKAKLMKDMTAE